MEECVVALTEKGLKLLGTVQRMLEAKGDNSTVSVEEIAEEMDTSIASVRGTMGK